MRLILACLLICAGQYVPAFAGPVTPKTTEVTVYRSGAKVSSVATVKVPAGVSDVVFENLSPFFNGNSLQVKIKGAARLNSAVFQLKTPAPEPENPRAQALRDSLALLGDDFVRLNNEKDLLTEEADLIRKNQSRIASTSPGNIATLTVAELQELAVFYRRRLGEIKERHLQLDIRKRELAKHNQRLEEELLRLQPNTGNQTGEIVLKLDAASALTLEITCTYLVNNAGWTPLYDLRSAGLDKPLTLVYKANVHNFTGFDWKGVRLHLSTAQPLANNNRPILNPVFVDFRPVAVQYQKSQELEEVVAYQMSQINMAANVRADDASPAGVPAPLAPAAGEDAGGDFIAGFDISNPQDILANGKDNIITVEEREMPVEYEYHAVPKIEPAVFLLAKLTDYGQYNLLSGTANIFFEETFVGQAWVDPGTTADTLLLSLGRDEQLTIKRVQPRDFKERRKIFGSRIRESYAFEITIKNNKGVAVTVDLLDQVPISKQKDIVVSLQDKDGAQYNPEFGKLQWKVEIPAGKSQKVRFSYSIEHPRDTAVGYFRN
ncbi:MAG: DUF4139 domain-containing protein [Saprospirales bacterium]|nr:DUF4139 domain-containing protein [Saprospirales bacterium]MBK8921264.1 DUF4139 domain-containing protein [Saprospirales bacterium]